jgi:hypothetical protein|tara:strand:- start:507 stop:653 length:147 start_codon:yes stop_codon:yes gene_type:complete
MGRIKMVKRKKKKKNIVGNFRGKEDVFWQKVVRGFKKFFEPPKRKGDK